MADAAAVFVVARVGWEVDPREVNFTLFGPDRRDTADPEDRRFVPVAAFADRAAADARRRELELDAARTFNPFLAFGPIFRLTSRTAADVVARLAERVPPLPAADLVHTAQRSNRAEWRAWWDDEMPRWPDDTLAAVWELFDAIRFYAVLKAKAE